MKNKGMWSCTSLFLSLLLVSCYLPRQSSPPTLNPSTGPAGQTPGSPEAMPSPSGTSLPTLTFTPVFPLVSVSVDTNCRKGPGQVYDYLAGFMVGEMAEVFGRDPTGRYLYIRDPDSQALCWVWIEYATVIGEVDSLPVFTPEPTPTPEAAFTFSYKTWGVGPGFQCLMFEVVNSGAVTWESFSLSINDVTQAYTTSTGSDAFTGYDGFCLNPVSKAALAPGETGTASVTTSFPLNPAGDSINATLKLCSHNGLSGICQVKSISFIF